jgi:two-component system cell cycle response regulator
MRILVADDDATSRRILYAIVTKLGHDCIMAEDGMIAWQLLSSQPVDVLLTDWMMPGLDGPDLCRRVREERDGHYISTVLVTGLREREQVLEGMNAGADDYLTKPVDPFDVETRLVAATRVTALHRQVLDYRTQLEHANTELLSLSLTDPLTGIGNRRRMDEDLARTHERARRIARPFAVVLFDIDHFKLYNDHYGHVAGDDALRYVALSIVKVARRHESLYRYGGEEFLLLLPDTNLDGALAAAERARRAVEEAAIPHEHRPTSPPLVTISGSASVCSPGSLLSTVALIAGADEGLYKAKLAGRNRVWAHDGPRTQGLELETSPPPSR